MGNVGGRLLIIGGAEDKEGECRVLKYFIEAAGGDNAQLAVITTAAVEPKTVGEDYRRIFEDLGVKEVDILHFSKRKNTGSNSKLDIIRDSTGIFFTGGDQLRITSLLGGTVVDEALRDAYARGTVVAGTSAGASVMSEIMIVEGDSEESPKKNTVKMAPGLGLVRGVVIDQHFAQRGRLGRLLTAVAQNPHILGVGIDEDTALYLKPEGIFKVVGSQTVTVVDGHSVTASNVSESSSGQPLALINVTVHILSPGCRFDLRNRCPITNFNG